MVAPFSILTSRLHSFRGKLIHQIAMWSVRYSQTPEAGKPWYLAARWKKPAYAVNDAPRKWWNRLDAVVKVMGLLPARADRCTYVSYTDVKKKKKKVKQAAHASDDVKATQSFDQSRRPLDEESYHRVYDDILEQLMEADECNKLRVWSFEVEKRDVYLTAKKTSPSWKKVTMRKTVDVDNDKAIQMIRSSTLATRIGAT